MPFRPTRDGGVLYHVELGTLHLRHEQGPDAFELINDRTVYGVWSDPAVERVLVSDHGTGFTLYERATGWRPVPIAPAFLALSHATVGPTSVVLAGPVQGVVADQHGRRRGTFDMPSGEVLAVSPTFLATRTGAGVSFLDVASLEASLVWRGVPSIVRFASDGEGALVAIVQSEVVSIVVVASGTRLASARAESPILEVCLHQAHRRAVFLLESGAVGVTTW